VGSHGDSLGWDQPSRALSAALKTRLNPSRSPARLIVEREYEYGSYQRGNAKAEHQPLAGAQRELSPAPLSRK
jgi:hypothetical protein